MILEIFSNLNDSMILINDYQHHFFSLYPKDQSAILILLSRAVQHMKTENFREQILKNLQ